VNFAKSLEVKAVQAQGQVEARRLNQEGDGRRRQLVTRSRPHAR
jgi:hypothetical protein